MKDLEIDFSLKLNIRAKKKDEKAFANGKLSREILSDFPRFVCTSLTLRFFSRKIPAVEKKKESKKIS